MNHLAMRFAPAATILFALLLASTASLWADEALVKALQELDTRVCPGKEEQKLLTEMLGKDIDSFFAFYKEFEAEAWAKVKTKQDW